MKLSKLLNILIIVFLAITVLFFIKPTLKYFRLQSVKEQLWKDSNDLMKNITDQGKFYYSMERAVFKVSR